MAYRAPDPPSPPPDSSGLEDYERSFYRKTRRRKIVFAAVVTVMALLGLGTCLGPLVVEETTEAWRSRKTKLTAAEAKEVRDLLDPLEAQSKKSQEAFERMWPKLRAGEIGARRDLGPCTVDVPGPNIRSKDESTSLQDSAQGVGWTFIDLTPESARSPLAKLEMPQGSIPLNNAGTGERFSLPPRPLHTAPSDNAPTLDSTATGRSVAKWRAEAGAPIPNDQHASFVHRVKTFGESGLSSIDVVVFVDLWESPKFGSPPSLQDDMDALQRGDSVKQSFQSGLAIARAFAWSPARQQLVCASQTLAQNSSGIIFRSSDLSPLQQDLVLQLEKTLQRSFVAVGDAPPRILRPAGATDDSDAGVGDAGSKRRVGR